MKVGAISTMYSIVVPGFVVAGESVNLTFVESVRVDIAAQSQIEKHV